MSAVAVDRLVVPVSMEAECAGGEQCERLAARTYAQLAGGAYTWPCSTMPLPASIAEWEADHRTARKRAWRAERLGYRFSPIHRHEYEADIFQINTSAPARQGRPMTDGYRRPVSFDPLERLTHGCDRHGIHTYGVLAADGHLVAYTWVYRVGELVMLSQILGHADHLANNVMYLLVRGAIDEQIKLGPGTLFYNRADSGTDGLRFFKTRVGFDATEIRWTLT